MLMFRPFVRFADFRGRATRSEYWLFVLLQAMLLTGCVVMAFASLGADSLGDIIGGFIGWLALAGLVMLIFAVPYLAVLARRLHDAGQSALWMLLLTPIHLSPYLSMFAASGAVRDLMNSGPASQEPAVVLGGLVQAMSGTMLISLIATVCSLILLVLTLLPGSRGPNRFGPDPRNPSAEPEAGPALYDDDRLEQLFAEAKAARATAAEAAPAMRAPQMLDPSAPAGVFGRRGAA